MVATASNAQAMERYNSTTSGRFGSLSSFDHDGRTDSISSVTSAGNSPKALRSSTSHTPTPITPLFNHTPTPITPSSSQSLLSPSTFTYSNPIGNYEFTSTPQTPNSASSAQYYSRGLSTAHSNSSNMLESPPYSPGRATQGEPPQLSQPLAHRRRTLFSHKRSKSNPPVHSISQEEEAKDEMSYQEPTNDRQYGNAWNRSSSPPSRTGSNPSITSHSVYGHSHSPSSIHRNKHPQMRRLSNMAPSFSQTVSNDQSMKIRATHHMVTSGSESALCRQNTCPESESDMYPRSYSLAGMGTTHRSVSSALDVTSTSMVDLPVRLHASSSEHLDQIEEYGRPDSNKSRSVPRLTFMTVSVESDRGEGCVQLDCILCTVCNSLYNGFLTRVYIKSDFIKFLASS